MLDAELVGAPGAFGVGCLVVLGSIPKYRRIARFGAFFRGNAAGFHFAKELKCRPACTVGSNPVEEADHDAFAGSLPAAVAGTTVDEDGLGPR